jgi:hypothetical protein
MSIDVSLIQMDTLILLTLNSTGNTVRNLYTLKLLRKPSPILYHRVERMQRRISLHPQVHALLV